MLWRGEETIEVTSLLPADAGYADVQAIAMSDTGLILVNADLAGERHALVLMPNAAS